MKLTKDEVLKLAKLSRLKLTDDEVEKYQNELSSIIEYVNQLESADVAGLEPTYQVTGLTNVFREDELTEQAEQAKLLKNVPSTDATHIKVKRMVG